MSTRTRCDATARNLEVEREDSPAGLDGHLLLAGQAMIVQILGDTADPVAAHLAFRAVGVEHPHPGVGSFRGHDQDQAIAADPEMAIADLHRELPGVGRRRLIERANVDVIVADPVHLGESHRSVAGVGGLERRTGSRSARDDRS